MGNIKECQSCKILSWVHQILSEVCEGLCCHCKASYRSARGTKETWKKQKDVSKHNTKVLWGKEQQQAFNKLKLALTTAPILAYPDYNCPFIIHTHASAILYQDFDGLNESKLMLVEV